MAGNPTPYRLTPAQVTAVNILIATFDSGVTDQLAAIAQPSMDGKRSVEF
jgi:hypothetical protein